MLPYHSSPLHFVPLQGHHKTASMFIITACFITLVPCIISTITIIRRVAWQYHHIILIIYKCMQIRCKFYAYNSKISNWSIDYSQYLGHWIKWRLNRCTYISLLDCKLNWLKWKLIFEHTWTKTLLYMHFTKNKSLMNA